MASRAQLATRTTVRDPCGQVKSVGAVLRLALPWTEPAGFGEIPRDADLYRCRGLSGSYGLPVEGEAG